MEAQTFTRRVYAGAPINGFYTISAIRFKQFGKNERFRTLRVENISEYESGCSIHRQCFGHMCETPNGTILPPQSMSMKTMEITSEYHAASRLAFAGDTHGYIERLKKTNYTKKGTMRGIMSTPIAGSCRLVVTPLWGCRLNDIGISKNLASRLKVCRRKYTDDSLVHGVYVETELSDGDNVIAVRPPSLNIWNTQPMKVKLWNIDCMGIHPATFSAFHGDFDGDEGHMYPVYDTDSIAECEAWRVKPLDIFDEGRDKFDNLSIELRYDDIPQSSNPEVDAARRRALASERSDPEMAKFIETTTLSAAQLKRESYKLVLGNYCRNKDVHITGIGNRFNDTNTEDSFVIESIRGTGDICRQQLSQGALGYMTRTAKVIASCFYRPVDGGLYVVSRQGNKRLVNDNIQDSGTPSVRAIANLCSVSQQAALDSHRAETHDTISHDLISDLILGCNRKTNISPTSHLTVVQFSSTVGDAIINSCEPVWRYTGYNTTILCEPSNVSRIAADYISAAYNPVVLSKIAKRRNDATEVCRTGIRLICNYYKIAMSQIELHDISVVFSYDPSASESPITTAEGVLSRSLGWIETLLATDYTTLPDLECDFETPNTSTAAMFTGNFNNMRHKVDSNIDV